MPPPKQAKGAGSAPFACQKQPCGSGKSTAASMSAIRSGATPCPRPGDPGGTRRNDRTATQQTQYDATDATQRNKRHSTQHDATHTWTQRNQRDATQPLLELYATQPVHTPWQESSLLHFRTNVQPVKAARVFRARPHTGGTRNVRLEPRNCNVQFRNDRWEATTRRSTLENRRILPFRG